MRYAYVAVIGALLATAGVQSWRLDREQDAHVVTQRNFAQYREQAASAAQEAGQRYRDQEAAWRRQAQGEINVAQEETRRVASARDAGAAVAARLQQQLAAARARSCPAPGAPTVAEGGASATTTDDLPTIVYRRLDEAAATIVGFADAAAIAGATCERISDGQIKSGQ